MAGLKVLWVAVLLLLVQGKYPFPSSWATWVIHRDTDRIVCPQIALGSIALPWVPWDFNTEFHALNLELNLVC